MTLPPALLRVAVESPDTRSFRLWLPLFLLWPLLLVLGVLALVLTLLVDIALWVAGDRYHHYTLFLLGVFRMTADLRGTTVHVRGDDSLVDVTIR
jgi:hypothetical protein